MCPQVNFSNNLLKLKKCLLHTAVAVYGLVSEKRCLWIVPLILGFAGHPVPRAAGASVLLHLFSRWTLTYFSALSILHLAQGNNDTENQE